MADVRTNLRVPEELYEQIKDLSEKELRSINAQMVVLLQAGLASYNKEQRLRRETEEQPTNKRMPALVAA